MQRSALWRSRRELSNEFLLAKFGFDTAENKPCKVCPQVSTLGARPTETLRVTFANYWHPRLRSLGGQLFPFFQTGLFARGRLAVSPSIPFRTFLAYCVHQRFRAADSRQFSFDIDRCSSSSRHVRIIFTSVGSLYGVLGHCYAILLGQRQSWQF